MKTTLAAVVPGHDINNVYRELVNIKTMVLRSRSRSQVLLQ